MRDNRALANSSVNNIRVSVVIPSYNSEKTIIPCLRSIINQDLNEQFEIIVVDSSVDGTSNLINKKFPEANLIKLQRKTNPGTARNLGVKNAKGEIVAFIDSDCVANPGWLSGICLAHRSENAAVGGPVINGNPQSIISWAGYLIEFNEWLPGNSRRFIKHIPTCNISYKKRVFEQFGGFPTLYPFEDMIYNFKLAESGEKILFEPNLTIKHSHRIRLRNFITHQIRRGKVGLQVRKKMPIRGAFLVNYPYLAPLLLPKRIITITASFLKRRPTNILVFLCSLPIIVLGVTCWIVGFMKGAYTEKIQING